VPAVDGGSSVTGSDVFEGTTSGGESATPVNAAPVTSGTSYTVTGLRPGVTYCFTVAAFNANGTSTPSVEASATPFAGAPTPSPSPSLSSPSPSPSAPSSPAPATSGSWLVGANGGVYAYGGAPFDGSLPGCTITTTDIVGIAGA
jgi:titin